MENSTFTVGFDELFRLVEERFHVLKLFQDSKDSDNENGFFHDREDINYPVAAMERIFPGYALLQYEDCMVKARELQKDMEMEMTKKATVYADGDGHETWWKGYLFIYAFTSEGVEDLKEKIEEGNPKYVGLILLEIKDFLHELMSNTFGKSLIQLIFQDRHNISCQQRDTLVYLIISNHRNLIDVCTNDIGYRAMQIVLENITRPFTQYAVVCTLNHIIVPLMTNVNGSNVILHCLKLFSETHQKSILNGIARNIVEIAIDKVGCSVIQKVLDNSGTIPKIMLVQNIISNALVLAEHPFGNYVLKYVIEKDSSLARQLVIIELRGKFARLSMNKYGSRVVEELLKFSSKDDREYIVKQILESNNFLNIAKDPFGNYVAHRALLCTQGALNVKLCILITICYQNELQGHLYGKNVLTLATIFMEQYNFLYKDYKHFVGLFHDK